MGRRTYLRATNIPELVRIRNPRLRVRSVAEVLARPDACTKLRVEFKFYKKLYSITFKVRYLGLKRNGGELPIRRSSGTESEKAERAAGCP